MVELSHNAIPYRPGKQKAGANWRRFLLAFDKNFAIMSLYRFVKKQQRETTTHRPVSLLIDHTLLLRGLVA
jgi:hypothetical protein